MTYRYRELPVQNLVPELIELIFVDKSLEFRRFTMGTGNCSFFWWYQNRHPKNLVPEKVSEPVSVKFGFGIKSRGGLPYVFTWLFTPLNAFLTKDQRCLNCAAALISHCPMWEQGQIIYRPWVTLSLSSIISLLNISAKIFCLVILILAPLLQKLSPSLSWQGGHNLSCMNRS